MIRMVSRWRRLLCGDDFYSRSSKVIRVDWLGNLASYKEDYNAALFSCCVQGHGYDLLF